MIEIFNETMKDPITCMGKYAAICRGKQSSDLSDDEAFRIGCDCLNIPHGRVLEFPQLYIELSGYSARVIREFYTHIGGLPTRLQESTRYMDNAGFNFVIPDGLSEEAKEVYCECMGYIQDSYARLQALGVKNEKAAMLLPLGMTTRIIVRTNYRHLWEMAHERLCGRAYVEFRELMTDIQCALRGYSKEWSMLADYLEPKCVYLGRCPENNSCGFYDAYREMTKNGEYGVFDNE